MNRNQTTPLTRKKKKRKSAGYDLTPVVAIIGILGLALTIYIAYRSSLSDRKLFSVSLLALFGGLLFESFRVSDKKTVIAIFVGSYFFSLFSFLPGKREQHYNFENHIQIWPYFLLVFFALAFAIAHKDKVTAKLTEGITLLLSLSFVYWIVDYGFTNYHNWFVITLLSIAFLFSALSIISALTYIHLSKGVRFTLSIWSTIILVVFAIDNIFRVFSNPDIESSKYMSDGLYIGLQYFLLGVCAVYIMQNYLLLAAFLPSRNGNYKNELREIKKDHIDRYSDQQVPIGHSLFCVLYTGTVYWLNYTYQFLPRHTMIWLVIVTFPLILIISTLAFGRKNHS